MTTTCTALVPMDTQALDIIKAINEPVVEIRPAARAMASIQATKDNISIEGALALLAALGYSPAKEVIYCGEKWVAKDLTNEEYFPHLQGRMAKEARVIWFWGGPPKQMRWYEGSLQTLLNDRVLCEIDEHGIFAIAELIGTDLEGLENDPF